jgi:hypothetical protein
MRDSQRTSRRKFLLRVKVGRSEEWSSSSCSSKEGNQVVPFRTGANCNNLSSHSLSFFEVHRITFKYTQVQPRSWKKTGTLAWTELVIGTRSGSSTSTGCLTIVCSSSRSRSVVRISDTYLSCYVYLLNIDIIINFCGTPLPLKRIMIGCRWKSWNSIKIKVVGKLLCTVMTLMRFMIDKNVRIWKNSIIV